MTHLPLLYVQVIGFVAILVQVIAWQYNKRSKITYATILAQIIFVLHFILLGAAVAAAVNVVGIARNVSYMKYKNKKIHILLIFIALQLLMAGIFWQGPISVLALFGGVLSTIAFWQTKPVQMRKVIIFMPVLWLGYNIYFMSLPGIISNVGVFVSTCLAIMRYDIKRNNTRE